MNLMLKRYAYQSDGIFGYLFNDDKTVLLDTLEHAYPENPTGQVDWTPKIPAGSYVCRRGQHQLEHMTHPFETFEVTGVPGHTNILFHVGNFNRDSDGCVLLGLGTRKANDQTTYVKYSQEAFSRFMSCLVGLDEFTLEVQ